MAKARNTKKVSMPKPTPASFEKIPFDPKDIGGELVSLLSEGLYSNPLDAIREYIQNAIDARAQRVSIKFTGRTVFIRDTGDGMTKDQLVAARRFAVSEKSSLTNIGFRGIGIYSAFHLCEKMRIRTKVRDTYALSVAEFDFAAMRKILGSERGSEKPARTSLIQLLSEHVTFRDEEYNLEDSFTLVELHGVSNLYYGNLGQRGEVEQYLLDTVPIDFSEQFPNRDSINARIRSHWPEYRPITINLQYDGAPDYAVVKSMPANLDAPLFREAKDDKGKVQAFIWGCRSKTRGMIDSKFAGFAYKIKGITVGKRSELEAAFSQKTLYRWWTGEIYVLNDKVIPSAARDKFEYNVPAHNLRTAVLTTLREQYERDAQRFQAVTLAEDVVQRIERDYERVESRAQSGILSPDETAELVNFREEASRLAGTLTRHEKTGDAKAAEVKARAHVLVEKLKELIKSVDASRPREDEESTKGRKRTRSARRPTPEGPGSDDGNSDSEAGGTATWDDEPASESLTEFLSSVGSNDATQAATILRVLVDVLEELLDHSSGEYRSVIDSVRTRLADDGLT